MDKLASRIKAARRKRGWSQEKLAAEADISRGYLARLETGRQDPTVGIVEKIARALRIKLADLFK